MSGPLLSVSVDHVATLRNARGGKLPCPVAAAKLALASGADAITVHLRANRPYIHIADLNRIVETMRAPLTLEMAATEEMVSIAERVLPNTCCLVPEKRREPKTESGLDLLAPVDFLPAAIDRLAAAGIRISILVEPEIAQLAAARKLGASCIQLHTGPYADARTDDRPSHLAKLKLAARAAVDLGLTCNAGHSLNYQNVTEIAAIPEIAELSIGHALIAQSVFEGISGAVDRFKTLMLLARSSA